jgi:hypothetical protein
MLSYVNVAGEKRIAGLGHAHGRPRLLCLRGDRPAQSWPAVTASFQRDFRESVWRQTS